MATCALPVLTYRCLWPTSARSRSREAPWTGRPPRPTATTPVAGKHPTAGVPKLVITVYPLGSEAIGYVPSNILLILNSIDIVRMHIIQSSLFTLYLIMQMTIIDMTRRYTDTLDAMGGLACSQLMLQVDALLLTMQLGVPPEIVCVPPGGARTPIWEHLLSRHPLLLQTEHCMLYIIIYIVSTNPSKARRWLWHLLVAAAV